MEDSTFDVYIHPSAVVDTGAQVGSGSKIWHFCHVSGGAILGARCNLGQNVFIADGVKLGNNVKIQNNVSIYAGVECADNVFLGPSMVFTNVTNPRSEVNRRGEYARTLVGIGATIGANATIVCGHDIGSYAFIGAGSVVTKTVKSFALVVGNPAKQIGWMSKAGVRLEFDQQNFALCSETNTKYLLKDSEVSLVK